MATTTTTNNMKQVKNEVLDSTTGTIIPNGVIIQAADNKSSILHESFLLSIQEAEGSIVSPSSLLPDTEIKVPTTKQRHIYESPEARARRLARNAERMRERRANESEQEYQFRLAKMAEASRLRRQNESELERTMRHLRDAARQRLRRAMESPDQRAIRLAKLAERSRLSREKETPEQKAERRRKCLEHNRQRFKRDVKDYATLPAASTNGTSLNIPFPHKTNHTENGKQLSPSSSTSTTSGGGVETTPSSSTSFENLYPQYHVSFKGSQFPDLPPHLAPNQPKYYGNIHNFMPSSSLPNGTVQYSQSVSTAATLQTQIPSISSTTLLMGNRTFAASSYQSTPPMYTQTPEVSRGRPIKILPSNNYQSIAPALQEEAIRQQRMNMMLEEQINIMLTSPKSPRGRPCKGKETDPQREERLRKMAEQRKLKRQQETPPERAARLKDLADRARKRREALLIGETEAERRERLDKQAQYARQRRLNSQTPQAIRMATEKAKTLYAKLHE